MASNQTTAWTERAKGVYQYALGPTEIAYRGYLSPDLYHGREYYALFYTCYFRIEYSTLRGQEELASRLKDAWLTLRYYNPALAVYVDGNDMVYRVLATEETRGQWLQETFITVNDPQARPEEYATRLSAVVPQSELYWFPHLSAVSLRMSHWRIGLSGMTSLFNRYFQYVVKPPQLHWGQEFRNLRRRFDECMHIEETLDTKAYCAEIFNRAYAAGPPTGFPIFGDAQNTVPQSSRAMTFTLNESETLDLIERVKTSKDTVTTVFHAALTQTVFDLAPPEFDGHKQVLALFRDMRRFDCVSSPYNGEDWAVENPLVGELIVVDPSKYSSVPELARYLTRKYHTEFDQERHLNALNSFSNAFMEMINGMVRSAMEGNPMPPSTMPRLSSLGIIESYLKRDHISGTVDHVNDNRTGMAVHVDDITMQAEHLVRESTFWLYTFANKLRLTVSWNEAFYDDAFIRKVFTTIFMHVGQALNLDLVPIERPTGSPERI